MLEITDRAADELARLLRQNTPGVRQAVRLSVNSSGMLAMTIDVPHAGDTLVRRNEAVLLIVEGRLSPQLASRVLDVPGADGQRQFTLKPQAGGALARSEVPGVA
jgi:Fe-S cluster assembly iron-binding protein IscA